MNHWQSLTDPSSLIPSPIAACLSLVAEPKPKKPKREKRTMQQHLRMRFEKSFRSSVLLLLESGSMDRRDFRALVERLADRFNLQGDYATTHAINSLVADGLMVCEVKLTAKGLQKLGLKGPQ